MLSLLLFLLITCASCLISKKDQDKYLLVTGDVINYAAKSLASRFEHPEMQRKVQLGFIKDAWRDVFGSHQTTIRRFDHEDVKPEEVRAALHALSKGLIFVPLVGGDGVITIYASWPPTRKTTRRTFVISTTEEGLTSFRLGRWCKRPFWMDTHIAQVRMYPNMLFGQLTDLLKSLRDEITLFIFQTLHHANAMQQSRLHPATSSSNGA